MPIRPRRVRHEVETAMRMSVVRSRGIATAMDCCAVCERSMVRCIEYRVPCIASDGVPGCSLFVCYKCDGSAGAKVWRKVDEMIAKTVKASCKGCDDE